MIDKQDEAIADAIAKAVYLAETIIHHDHEAHWREVKRLNGNLWKDVGNAALAEFRAQLAARGLVIVPTGGAFAAGMRCAAEMARNHYATISQSVADDILAAIPAAPAPEGEIEAVARLFCRAVYSMLFGMGDPSELDKRVEQYWADCKPFVPYLLAAIRCRPAAEPPAKDK